MSERESSSTSNPDHGRRGAGRGAVAAVLIVALLATGAMHHWVRGARAQASNLAGQSAAVGTGTSLSSMNSFALALLLGGLRGPLVMILWTSSESQKNEKQLEDFDTKVEWIRLLQPEFDTVHIFQIWNKAYNISVQMASLANKYTTILDALDYAQRVNAERPNNINILSTIASTYFDKLGNSAEKVYYRNRVRAETLPHKGKELARTDPGWRPMRHEALLDDEGYLAGDGKRLTYLAPYEPFPYGLTPYAISYDYYKRAQLLQNENKQKHIQLSELVVDSRPGLALKHWSEEERERARRAEAKLFDQPTSADWLEMELPTASVPPAARQRDPLIDEAMYSYALAARLARDAQQEYEAHIRRFDTNRLTYLSHIAHLQVLEALMAADHDYLASMIASGSEQRQALMRSARQHYQRAVAAGQQLILKYYIDDDIVAQTYPQGYSRANIEQLPAEQYGALLERARRAQAARFEWDPMAEDRTEYERYVERAQKRLEQLKQVLPS